MARAETVPVRVPQAHHELLAYEALPVQALRMGYRVVRLRSPTGSRLRHGSLLIRLRQERSRGSVGVLGMG